MTQQVGWDSTKRKGQRERKSVTKQTDRNPCAQGAHVYVHSVKQAESMIAMGEAFNYIGARTSAGAIVCKEVKEIETIGDRDTL